MLASFNWIKDFVDFKADAPELVRRLAMAGLESEILSQPGKGIDDHVVTAQILKIDKHPNADRLSLCEVQFNDEVSPVVCGANNMKAGDKVVLARPGAKLPGGLVIKVSKIRKVESQGMLCSESELGLADTSEGILILPPETPLGLPLTQALDLGDTILEIEVTPNRGDCLSIQGLSREVAANFHLPFKSNETPTFHEATGKSQVEVNVRSQERCGRYACRVLSGIKVGPSPQHVVRRLESCGIRAINNIVDATNYIMLETGQPLHAFDLKEIRRGQINIRTAESGEKMKTLDGIDRELNCEDLVIADGERILALAGVMGGEDSGVSEATTEILLESAWFQAGSVRKTARRLGLQTESSYRFERGVDPSGCVAAINRLTEVILEVAGGKVLGSTIDHYPDPVRPIEVTLRPSRIQRILGIALEAPEIMTPLQALGISGEAGKGGDYHFQIPTYRSDLNREIDLIEEVARLYGYDRIPATYPSIHLSELLQAKGNSFDQLDHIRTLLTGWGFHEVLHYSFTSHELLKKFSQEFSEEQSLLNPISEDQSVMRPALFPQMVQTLQSNVFKGNKDLRFFELRPVYRFDREGDGKRPFQESWHLCLGMSGARRSPHFLEKESATALKEFKGLTLLDLKGYLEALFHRCLPGIKIAEGPLNLPYFHPNRQMSLTLQTPGTQGETVAGGFMGRLHPAVLAEMDVPVPILIGEIYLDLFLTEWKNSIQFEEISPFPTIWRDINLIVDEKTPSGEVLRVIRAQGGLWLRRAELFDLYRGKPLEAGKKALTYRLEYGAKDRTLTDEEVNGSREKLLEQLKHTLGATLR